MRPIISIVGATATGKSAVAVELARQLGGPTKAEIINVDAAQFYRGMDIGTAKIPVSERAGITHHFLDFLPVSAEASVAKYQAEARKVIADIQQAGKWAITVGGSGLYNRALLDEFDFPGHDPVLRAQLEARADAEGIHALYQELFALAPDGAQRLHPNNAKRVIRALEIYYLTGSYSGTLPPNSYVQPTLQFALALPFAKLEQRIATRTQSMWDSGLVDEVKRLGSELKQSLSARRIIGYAQTLQYLAGELTAAEAVAAIAQATRKLARKQPQWFAADARVVWVPAPNDAGDVATTATHLRQLISAQQIKI